MSKKRNQLKKPKLIEKKLNTIFLKNSLKKQLKILISSYEVE